MKLTLLTAALLATIGAGSAFASERCNVPMAEWQTRETLQKKLEGDGWKVQRVKTDDGCYEVHGTNEKGVRVEARFDPKTFEAVKIKDED